MPSTYSPKLKFELIAPGEQPGLWGNTTNKNVGELIEQAIAGVTTLDLTSVSGNYTLTSLDGTLDQARSAVVSCQGTAAGAVSVIIPTSTKLYVFRNACGQTITIKTAGQVGGVVLANGEANSVFCDGTNALAGLVTAGAGTTPVSGGGTGQTSFTAGFLVSPSPGGTTALTTQAKINLLTDVVNTLPVANGGTGQASLNPGGLLIGNGTGSVATLTGGVNGYVPTWSTATNTWVSTAPSAAGVSSVSATAPITVGGTASAPNIGISSSPSFTTVTTSGGITANAGFLTNGSPFNFTSNTGFALNAGTSTVQLAINGQSAATFNSTAGIVSSAALTTGANPSYFNTQAYVSSNALGVNGTGVPSNAGVYYDVSGTGWVISGGAGRLNFAFTNAVFVCGSDNAASVGDPSRRWSVIYAVNGSINTSDLNEKTEIADLNEAEKRVATRIKGLIKKFKWKDSVAEKGSAGARIHVGVIAQEVKAAFEAEGLDAHRYGMFCFDEWEEQLETVNGDGVVMQTAVPAGARYGVRYEELLAFVIAAL